MAGNWATSIDPVRKKLEKEGRSKIASNFLADKLADSLVISPLQSAVVDREAGESGFLLQYALDRMMRAAHDACSARRIFHSSSRFSIPDELQLVRGIRRTT